MKTFLIFFLSTCFFFKSLSAQVSLEKTILWQVSGNNLAAPSYLFGTFHLLCADDLQLSQTLLDKFDVCKKLMLEIDFSDPSLGLNMMEAMKMQHGTTLNDLYPPSTYDSVSYLFQHYAGVSLEPLKTMKPTGLYSLLMVGLLKCPPASWELKLSNMAKQKGTPIGGLESLESQAAIFDSIPYALQAQQLKQMVYHADSTSTAIRQLITAYQEQDINQLYKSIVNEPGMEEYLPLILYQRNANWIPIMIKEAKQHSTFFAFGAGHLGGEKGIVNLLRKAGYTVSPVY